MHLSHLLLVVAAISVIAATPLLGAESFEPPLHRLDGSAVTPRQIDADIEERMKQERVPGLALALIEDGKVVYVKSYGLRNVENKQPLETDTVMYAASLTKLAFAYMVLQLVDEKIVDLDKPIAAYLKKPLPEYPKYADLAGDPRWKALTARILLDHTSGFP